MPRKLSHFRLNFFAIMMKTRKSLNSCKTNLFNTFESQFISFKFISETGGFSGKLLCDIPDTTGELKRSKYQEIAEEGKAKGWRVKIWTVEVGCKGFPAASMSSLLKDLGYPGTQRNNCARTGGITDSSRNLKTCLSR